MRTVTRRKSARFRKVRSKSLPVRRAKLQALVLSEAEIARINGAQESLVALP